MTIGASAGQMRLLHVKAKQAGENRDMIRDRGARLWDMTSLTELTMEQARELIEIYDDLINPPEPAAPVVMGRGAFGGLPKRVTPTPAVEAPKHVVRVSVAPKVLPPAPPKPRTVHNFDPALKIRRGDGLEEIPF
jgi:hypothetical protein